VDGAYLCNLTSTGAPPTASCGHAAFYTHTAHTWRTRANAGHAITLMNASLPPLGSLLAVLVARHLFAAGSNSALTTAALYLPPAYLPTTLPHHHRLPLQQHHNFCAASRALLASGRTAATRALRGKKQAGHVALRAGKALRRGQHTHGGCAQVRGSAAVGSRTRGRHGACRSACAATLLYSYIPQLRTYHHLYTRTLLPPLPLFLYHLRSTTGRKRHGGASTPITRRTAATPATALVTALLPHLPLS